MERLIFQRRCSENFLGWMFRLIFVASGKVSLSVLPKRRWSMPCLLGFG